MADLEETWKAWIRRFWWLRGVTTALALTALVPTFIDLSRYEFLRAFHAVIVGWNLVTEKLGEIIGEIPFIPQISGEVVSTLIFIISIGLPIFIAVMKDLIIDYYVDKYGIYYILRLIIVSGAPFVITLSYYGTLVGFYDTPEIFILLAALLLSLLMTILALPGYGKGLLFVASFIIAMEVLYVLKTPLLAEQISQFVCEALEAPPENCLPSTEGS